MLNHQQDDVNETISRLAPRRREALQHLSQGFSDEEIAAKMELGLSTIISYNSMNYSILGLARAGTLDQKRAAAMRLYREWAAQQPERDEVNTVSQEQNAFGGHDVDDQQESDESDEDASDAIGDAEVVAHTKLSPREHVIALSMEISDPDRVIGAPKFVVLEQPGSDQEALLLQRLGYTLEAVTQFLIPDTFEVVGTAIYVKRR